MTIVTLSLPESNLESTNLVVTFESVDETLVCYHSNKSYRAVLSSDAVCVWLFCKMKFKIFSLVLSLALLGVKGLIKWEYLRCRTFNTPHYCSNWKSRGYNSRCRGRACLRHVFMVWVNDSCMTDGGFKSRLYMLMSDLTRELNCKAHLNVPYNGLYKPAHYH